MTNEVCYENISSKFNLSLFALLSVVMWQQQRIKQPTTNCSKEQYVIKKSK